MLELKLSVSIGDDVNDFCIEAITAGCKKPRLYHATVETTWACFGETSTWTAATGSGSS